MPTGEDKAYYILEEMGFVSSEAPDLALIHMFGTGVRGYPDQGLGHPGKDMISNGVANKRGADGPRPPQDNKGAEGREYYTLSCASTRLVWREEGG